MKYIYAKVKNGKNAMQLKQNLSLRHEVLKITFLKHASNLIIQKQNKKISTFKSDRFKKS